MPIRIGMPMKNTIVVPCIVNSWLNVSGPKKSLRGTEELPAHQQGFAAADDQKDHGHQDVHDADLLVIDRGRPSRAARPSSGRRSRVLRRRSLRQRPCSVDSPSASIGASRQVVATISVAVAGRAQAEGRHQAARLDLPADRRSSAQMLAFGVVRNHARGQRLRGSSGASGRGHSSPWAGGPAHAMAIDARLRQKRRLAVARRPDLPRPASA